MAYHYSGVGPPSYGRYIELVPVFLDVLNGSKVKKGEKVVIYTDTQKNKDIVDAYFIAANVIGAEVIVILSTPRNDPNREPFGLAFEAMKNADFIIDLASISWIYTPQYSELLSSGKRIVCNMANVDSCLSLFPTQEIINKTVIGGKLIHNAGIIEVKSEEGTNLMMSKKGRRGDIQEGLSPEPGDWDNYPSAQCSCCPIENSLNGKLILKSGDIILPLKRILSSAIEITIKDGRIVSIEGGAEAGLLKGWFEQWNDPNSYVISHIGFGCEPRAEIGSMEMMQWESYEGNMMIAFGKNIGYFLDGVNKAKSHIDFVCFDCDFILDGNAVVKKGEFVEEMFK